MKKIVAAISMFVLCTSVHADAVLIDDFEDPSQQVFVFGGPGSSLGEASGTSPIGGTRALQGVLSSGVGSQVNLTGAFSGGQLDITTSVGASGRSVTTWDGLLDGTGGSAMLMADFSGNDRFRFDVTSFQAAVDGSFAMLAMKVTDSDSAGTSTAVDVDSTGSLDILFSDFVGIDFSDVKQLDLIVTLPAGSGARIDTATATVPEPAAIAALASLAPIGLFALRRRRKHSVA